MSSHHRPVVSTFACTVVVVAAAASLVRAQPPDAAAPDPPTRVEEALIQYRCDASSGAADALDPGSQCLSLQLASLRVDFGYNLGRLAAADRKKIDAACPSPGRPETRDAYVRCLDANLRAIHDRSLVATPPSAADEASAPAPSIVGTVQADSRSRSTARTIVELTLGSGVLLVAGIGTVMMRRRWTPPVAAHACRVCGVTRFDGGDLCPTCRHEVAAAARQAAAERRTEIGERRTEVGEQRTEGGEQRAEEPVEIAPAVVVEATPAAHETRPEQPSHVSSDFVISPPPDAAEPRPSNPYTILGVSPQSNADEIRAAYQAALERYDESAVSFLGNDVQQHFAAMRRAVEEAYHALNA